MASRRRKLFEELGLLADEEQLPNPYLELGVSPHFVRELLEEDPSGEAVRLVAVGMYRALARRYHPDVQPDERLRARFGAIERASQRIGGGSLRDLTRWTKVEPEAPRTTRVTKQQEAQHLMARRAAQLVQTNMELGQHPQHFSQLGWSQGLLLQRDEFTLLMRQRPTGGLQVLRGETFVPSKTSRLFSIQTQAFDFHAFMMDHRSFDLPPDEKIVTYLDETGRASILKPDLSFVMDITDSVAAYRKRRKTATGIKVDASDAWSRSPAPLLFITRVPGPESVADPEAQILSFPSRLLQAGASRDLEWDLPMEVVGSIGDEDFFRTVRYSRAAGAAALTGTGGRSNANYFGLATIPTQQLIEHDAGYSPLLTAGNSLLLYDTESHMPVATNTKVVGMLGNGAQGYQE